MWIKFWVQYHLRSGDKEETHYFWSHDDDGTNWDDECLEWAMETSTGQAQWHGGGHSFEYEAFKLDRLPDDVRAQMIKEYEDRVLNAQKMLDILMDEYNREDAKYLRLRNEVSAAAQRTKEDGD